MPLPKKSLTQVPRWLVRHVEERAEDPPSAYRLSRTKVASSPRSFRIACSSSRLAIRVCPDEGVRRRVALEDILDLRPCSSERRDQYGKIVPAIACVQNAVVVSFVLTRKENDKASADIILNHAEDPRDTRKAEECARAKGRNDGGFREGLDGRHGHAPIPAGPRRTVSSSTMSPAIRRSIRPSRFASRTKQLLRGIAIDQPRRDEDAATACGAGEPEGEGGSRGGRP